jgi:hypothetical protein
VLYLLVLYLLAQVDVVDAVLKPDRIAFGSLALLIIIAFIKGWIVPKASLDAERARADRMEDRAFRATDALPRAVDTVDKVATAVMQQRKDGQ